MSEPELTAAHHLVGERLEGGWKVIDRVDWFPDRTGSTFSVGYWARNEDGRKGFMKAFDYVSALSADDPAEELRRLTDAYIAERDLLQLCGDKRLNRIVHILAFGSVKPMDQPFGTVQYLIFEPAHRDARDATISSDLADQVPKIQMAHGVAAALTQLHQIGITHQDVKPSNVLVWEKSKDYLSKLGDLGCAHLASRPAPHDNDVIPGDVAYAAPEQLYECEQRLSHPHRRQAADVFMLGNLMVFLLVGVPYSGLLALKLEVSQRPANWSGTFDEILPALIDAHGQALSQLRGALHREIAEPVTDIVDRLCHPDLNFRGDKVERQRNGNPFLLQRFISRLDWIYRTTVRKAA